MIAINSSNHKHLHFFPSFSGPFERIMKETVVTRASSEILEIGVVTIQPVLHLCPLLRIRHERETQLPTLYSSNLTFSKITLLTSLPLVISTTSTLMAKAIPTQMSIAMLTTWIILRSTMTMIPMMTCTLTSFSSSS